MQLSMRWGSNYVPRQIIGKNSFIVKGLKKKEYLKSFASNMAGK